MDELLFESFAYSIGIIVAIILSHRFFAPLADLMNMSIFIIISPLYLWLLGYMLKGLRDLITYYKIENKK